MPRRAPTRMVRPARRRIAAPAAPAPARPPIRRAPQRWWLLATTALLPVTGTALAQTTGPTGGQVVAGQAAIAQGANRTTITQRTDRAAIDWQQFNVGSQHTVQFVQPSQGSWTLNRVVGPDPSVIAGRVQANGGVAIVNQSGMIFAGGAQVEVGALIASAANITNQNFMAGRMVFDGAPRPGARVENRGTITVADRGLAALVGPGVSNSGVIRARLGRVALGAAETFVLDLAGDGLIGLDVTRAVTTAPEGGAALVTNSGVIEAAGGSVLLSAHAASGLVEDLVRNTGRIEAPSIGTRTGEVALRAEGGGVRQDGTIAVTGGATERGGRVALQATSQVTVGAAARIDASGGAGGGQVLVGTTGRGRNQTMAARTTVERGATIRADATRNGTGGEIVVNSADRTEMRGTLSAQGGAQGGNGGFIEVSGQAAFVLDGIVDLRAPAGAAGEFLLDPRNIFIADAGTPLGIGGNTITETPADLTTVAGSVTGPGAVSATSGGNTTWVQITPDVIEGYAAGNITLEASRQIVIGSEVDRTTAGNLTLRAGLGGAAGTGNITQRTGANVSVNGVLTLETGVGAIALAANVRATEVVLSASGNINQTTGSIAHRVAGTELPLTVTASGGSSAVTLAGTGNGSFALGASSAGGNFTLAGDTIRLTGDLVGNAVSLTARTGAIGLGANVRATDLTLAAATGIAQGPGTTIRHRSGATTALPVSANVSGTGDIVLNGANGNLLLRSGGTAAGLLTVDSAERIAIGSGQTVSVAGAATLTVTGNGNPLVLDGTLLADSVTLTAAGSITQDGASVLARRAAGGGADLTAELPLTATVTGNGHALSLPGNNGPLQVLGATTDDGNIALRGRSLTIAGAVTAEANGAARSDVALTATVGGIAIDGTVTARNASLIVAGDLTQSVALDLGGTGGGLLTVRGPGGGPATAAGSITLTEANLVTELDARATGALAFTAAGDLAVTQARGDGVTLVGAAIAVPAGAADESGVVATGTGGVAIVADSLTVPGTLTAPDGQTIALRVDALDLSGGTVSAGATGTVEIGPRTATHAVQVGTTGSPANTLELAIAELEAITAGTLRIGRTTIASEATATITANGLTVADPVAPGAALSLISANGITVSADITAPAVRMEATTGSIALGAVNVQADGPGAAITLLAADAITQSPAGLLVAPAGTTVDLIAHAQSGIALAGTGDFRLAGGETPSGASGERSLYSWFGISFATTGTITVAAPVESLAAATIVSLSGGAISVEAPITTSVGSQLDLTATGNASASTITQTAAGLISTGTLTLSAEGAIDLAQAANAVGTLGTVSFTDGFGYRSTTGFTVGGALAPSNAGNANITIIADTGDILLQAPIGAGTGTVRLEATTGDILQNAAGAAITAGRLQVTAGGDALLDPTLAADRNAVGVLGAGTVGGTLAFNAAGNLALDGTIAQGATGGVVRIESGGTLTLNAGASLGFDGITLTAPGLMTLRGTIGVDQATPVSVVRLGAGGGITQDATGRIVADQLGIRATGDVALMAGTNDVRQVAASASGIFALDTNGALATASITAVPLPGDAAATVAGVLGTSVTLSATDLTINPAGLGGFLGAGAFASAVDGVLTLRADTLTLNSLVGAGDPSGSPTFNGTIAIEQRTLGRGIVIGGLDAGALSLSAGDIFGLVARNIVIGRSEAGVGALTVAGTADVQNGVNSVLLQGGGIALDGTFTVSTAGGLLTLSAVAGDITQGAGSVSAPRLVAEAPAGSVLLDGNTVLNQVGQIAGSAGTGQDFAFRGAGSYVIAAPGILATDGTVTLLAPGGGITQALGAPITADRLTVNAQGAVVLDGGGPTAGAADINHVATLGPSQGTSVTLRNADALTVEGVTANGFAGSTIVLEAPTLTLAGNVIASTADGRVILRTGADFDAPGAGTAITQTGGIIRTRDLSASAGDEIDLARNNEVTRLAAGQGATAASTDSIVLRDGGTLSLTDAAGGIEVAARVNAGTGSGVQVVADGLTVAPGLLGTVFLAPGGVVRFLPFTAGATIGLGGVGDATTYATSLLQRVDAGRLVIGSDTAGTLTLRQALDLTGANGPVALELHSGGDIQAGGFNLALRQVSAFAGGNVVLGTAGSAIQRVVAGETVADGIQAGGTVSVTTAGTLAVDAAIRADGATVSLQAADFVLAPGAAVQTGAVPGSQVRLRSTNGAGLALGVTDAAPGLSQQEIALLDARGGTLRLEGAAIDLAGTVAVTGAAASLLDLAATGAVTQSAGTLAAAALRVDGASVQIDRAGNSLPQIQATATGNVSVATDGATTILGTRSSTGDVAISAGSITLSGAAGTLAVQAAGTASLTATNGDITGAAGLAAVQAPLLNATASGAVTLTGDNAVGTLAAIAGTGVTFDNTIALTAGATGAGGTSIAGNVTLDAPSLRLNTVLATGTVDLTASAGTIDQAAGVRLAAGTLRAAATGSVILDAANPDGTARNQIQDIDALSAGGDITLRNAIALTLDLPLSVGAGQVLTLEAPTLTIGDNLSAGAGGRILLRTGSFNGGVASGGNITQTGGTISAPQLAALAGGSVSLDRVGNAIGTLGGGRSAAGVDLGLGLNAGTSGALRSAGFGGSATLGVAGALDIGSGGSLVLRADDFAIAAAIRVPSGTITLLPYSAGAGIGYVLGGASGSSTAGRITLDSTELSFFPAGTPAAELILGALGVTGSVDIAGAVSLATGGATPRVNQLTLVGDGALTQAAGTSIDVAALRAIFPNGAVLLDPDAAGNRIAALGGVVAGGDVNIRGGAGLMTLRDGGGGAAITVVPAGRTITLRADDLNVQALVQAPGGTINILPETPGRVVTLGGVGAGTMSLTTAEIERIGGGGPALDEPAAARLRIGSDGTRRTAGNILVIGDVPLRDGATVRVGTLELVAGRPGTAGGSVRQTAGSVDVATVTGTAQGDFRLGLAGNAFDAATGITAGTLPAAGATGVVELGTAGALAATDITAPVSIRLTAGAGLSAGDVTAPVILLQGGSVTLTDLIQGSTSVTIDSAGAVTQQAGALIVTGLFTLNGGSVSLPEDNQIVELNDLVATGPIFALNTTLSLLVSGAVSAVGSLNLSTDQNLTVANTGSITVTAGGLGEAVLTAGGAIDYAGRLTTDTPATLTAGGALSFTGVADIGNTLTLAAGAGMTLAGDIGAANALLADAVGALSSTANLSAGAGIGLAAGTTLDLGGSWSSGDSASFIAGGLLTYRATGIGQIDVTLATPGAITVAAGSSISALGTARLNAGTDLTASGSIGAGPLVELTAGTGSITLAGSIGATDAVTVNAGGAIASTAAITAFEGNAALTAGTTLDLANSLVAGGTITLGATGAMTLAGTIDATGGLTATAGGAITTTAAISAGGAIAMTAGGALAASNSIDAGGTLTLGAGAGLDLGGTWSAGGATSFTAQGLIAYTATGTGGAGVTFTTPGAITASAASSIEGAGTVRLDAGTDLSALGAVTGGPLVAFSAATGGVTLGGTIVADGAMTASAGGAIATTAAITASGGDVTMSAGTTLDFATSLIAGGTITFGAAGAMTLTGTLDGAALVATAGGALTTDAAISIVGNAALTAGAALDATNLIAAGGTLALDAGTTMTLGGAWSAGAAATFSAGGLLTTSATGIGGADVTFTSLGAITATAASSIQGAGTVRLDAGTDLSASGAIRGGPLVDLRAGTGTMTLAGTLAATGDLTAAAGAALTTTAAISAGGDVAMTAGGALAGSNSIVAGGALTIDAGAAMDLAGSWTAGGAAAFTAGGLLTAGGRIESTGGDVLLTGATGLAANGTFIAAGAATLAATTGTLTLDGSLTAGGAVALTAASGDLTLAGTVQAGDGFRASAAGALQSTADITATGAPGIGMDAGTTLAVSGRLEATAGIGFLSRDGVIANGTFITGGDVDVDNITGGLASLAGSIAAGGQVRVNAGAALDISAGIVAGGDVILTPAGALTITGPITAAGAVDITGGGAITLSGRMEATGGNLRVESQLDLNADATLVSGRGVTLAATFGDLTLRGAVTSALGTTLVAGSAGAGGSLDSTAQITAGGAVVASADGTITMRGRVESTGGTLALLARSGLTAQGDFIAAGPATLLRTVAGPLAFAGTLRASGSATFETGGAATLTGSVSAGGPLTVMAGLGLGSTAQIVADGAITLSAGGGLTLGGSLATSDALNARAGGDLTANGTITAAAGAVLQAGGALTQAGSIAGATVALSAGGLLTQSGLVSAVGEMRLAGGAIASSGTLTAGGPITLSAGGALAQSGILQSGQDAGLFAGGSLTLTGLAVAAGNMTLSAGGAATLTGGKITAGEEVRLTAGQGITVQSFQVDPSIIVMEAAGALSMAESALVSGESIRLAGSTVTLRGNTITTGTLDVDAAGTLTLDGGTYIIGRAVGFTAPGGITSPTVIVVTPRDGLLPAVIFDTRAPGAVPDPLTVVQPDIPGLPNNQQATQVRLPGTEVPGAFGPASAAPAGPMGINIDAGRSAIFLLLDGGSVTGTIVSAGRLGIHGTGGSAELTGQLVDVSGSPVGGQNAARFADSTRPASTGALTRYRINGCVVSSINCVVPSQVLTIPQAPPQRIDIRLGGGAITDPDVQLPNVADEDY